MRFRATRSVAGAGLAMAALLLASCTSLSEQAESLDPGFLTSEVPTAKDQAAADVRRRGEEEMDAADESGIPNLAEVPERPSYGDSAVRAQIATGLLNDRQSARYTAEALAANQRIGAPIAPTKEYSATERVRESSTSTAVSASVLTQVTETPGSGQGEGLPPDPLYAAPAAAAASPRPDLSEAPVAAPPPRAELAAAPVEPAPAPTPAPAAVAPTDGGSVTVDTSVLGAPALPTVAAGQTLLATIYFAHGSTGLVQGDADVIAQIAEIQRRRGGRLIVVGHSSGRTGQLDLAQHEQVNVKVSLKRANAVASELTRQGLSADLITVQGAGASQPIYQETMPTGEAGNRRVEIFLTQ